MNLQKIIEECLTIQEKIISDKFDINSLHICTEHKKCIGILLTTIKNNDNIISLNIIQNAIKYFYKIIHERKNDCCYFRYRVSDDLFNNEIVKMVFFSNLSAKENSLVRQMSIENKNKNKNPIFKISENIDILYSNSKIIKKNTNIKEDSIGINDTIKIDSEVTEPPSFFEENKNEQFSPRSDSSEKSETAFPENESTLKGGSKITSDKKLKEELRKMFENEEANEKKIESTLPIIPKDSKKNSNSNSSSISNSPSISLLINEKNSSRSNSNPNSNSNSKYSSPPSKNSEVLSKTPPSKFQQITKSSSSPSVLISSLKNSRTPPPPSTKIQKDQKKSSHFKKIIGYEDKIQVKKDSNYIEKSNEEETISENISSEGSEKTDEIIQPKKEDEPSQIENIKIEKEEKNRKESLTKVENINLEKIENDQLKSILESIEKKITDLYNTKQQNLNKEETLKLEKQKLKIEEEQRTRERKKMDQELEKLKLQQIEEERKIIIQEKEKIEQNKKEFEEKLKEEFKKLQKQKEEVEEIKEKLKKEFLEKEEQLKKEKEEQLKKEKEEQLKKEKEDREKEDREKDEREKNEREERKKQLKKERDELKKEREEQLRKEREEQLRREKEILEKLEREAEERIKRNQEEERKNLELLEQKKLEEERFKKEEDEMRLNFIKISLEQRNREQELAILEEREKFRAEKEKLELEKKKEQEEERKKIQEELEEKFKKEKEEERKKIEEARLEYLKKQQYIEERMKKIPRLAPTSTEEERELELKKHLWFYYDCNFRYGHVSSRYYYTLISIVSLTCSYELMTEIMKMFPLHCELSIFISCIMITKNKNISTAKKIDFIKNVFSTFGFYSLKFLLEQIIPPNFNIHDYESYIQKGLYYNFVEKFIIGDIIKTRMKEIKTFISTNYKYKIDIRNYAPINENLIKFDIELYEQSEIQDENIKKIQNEIPIYSNCVHCSEKITEYLFPLSANINQDDNNKYCKHFEKSINNPIIKLMSFNCIRHKLVQESEDFEILFKNSIKN